MISPNVPEERWRQHCDDLPIWQPPLCPTIIVSPHPDDETLGAGGLISFLRASNIDVQVVAVTSGENAYEGVSGLGPIREKEQTLALERLGVQADRIHHLRLIDSDVVSQEEQLAQYLRTVGAPDAHMVAPWLHDFHPDHEVCGRVAQQVANERRMSFTSYFFWTWHRGSPEMLNDLPLVRLMLNDAEYRAREDALQCHHSQLFRDDGEPILPSNLLSPMTRPYEVFLPS